MIRKSLLLKIHIQVIMLQAKESATILYCLHYLCILAITWRLAVAVLGIIPTYLILKRLQYNEYYYVLKDYNKSRITS